MESKSRLSNAYKKQIAIGIGIMVFFVWVSTLIDSGDEQPVIEVHENTLSVEFYPDGDVNVFSHDDFAEVRDRVQIDDESARRIFASLPETAEVVMIEPNWGECSILGEGELMLGKAPVRVEGAVGNLQLLPVYRAHEVIEDIEIADKLQACTEAYRVAYGVSQ
ncbi:MAG: hypothetical protein AAF413_03715 [Patescibacteria group bacterium]